METGTIVITLTVFFTETLKRYLSKTIAKEELAKFWAPFSAILIGIVLNLGMVLLLEVTDYSAFWSNFQWRESIKEGISIGMKAGGLYGVAKVVTREAKLFKQNW